MTTESAPEDVKKSPLGEKLTVFDGPSCPYRLYKMCPLRKSQIFTVESKDDESRYLPLGWKAIWVTLSLAAS